MRSVAPPLSPVYSHRAPPRFAHYATALLNRACDAWWERRLGVRTTGDAASTAGGDGHRYGYLAYHTYFRVFDRLALEVADRVLDLGCGKGRALCAAAQYPVVEVIGVEIDSTLCATAEENIAALRRHRAPVRVVRGSAVEFDYDAVTAIAMFHPFGPVTMQAVLARLEKSLALRPRRLRIAYVNPWHSLLLAAQPWLELYACWNPPSWSRIKFPVHFYRTVTESFARHPNGTLDPRAPSAIAQSEVGLRRGDRVAMSSSSASSSGSIAGSTSGLPGSAGIGSTSKLRGGAPPLS
jgi:SAM-dependent methyltransferase